MNKINFENAPSTNTPLCAENLNQMQANMEKIGAVVSATEPTTNEKVWFKKSNNLFNKSNVVDNLFINENKFGVATDEYVFYIQCEPSTAYSIQRTSNNTSGLIVCCSGNIPASNVATTNTINYGAIDKLENYITSSNAKYLCIRINPMAGTATLDEIINSFMVVKGSKITPYEPYVEKEIRVKNANGVFEPFTDIETITNENGTAIKYPNGTMICTNQLIITTQSNAPVGASYYSFIDVLKPFPHAFIEKPRISVDNVGDYWAVAGTAQANTNYITAMGLITFTPDPEPRTYVFDYIAIGRWK